MGGMRAGKGPEKVLICKLRRVLEQDAKHRQEWSTQYSMGTLRSVVR
jgi:hypothetical protein